MSIFLLILKIIGIILLSIISLLLIIIALILFVPIRYRIIANKFEDSDFYAEIKLTWLLHFKPSIPNNRQYLMKERKTKYEKNRRKINGRILEIQFFM